MTYDVTLIPGDGIGPEITAETVKVLEKTGIKFKWDNVALRKEFDLFANLRPAVDIVPGGRYGAIDIVMVRENVEGLYIGVEHYTKVADDPHAVA